MASKTFEVSETFLTFQGEGKSIGKRAVFLRLRRCNLQCRWHGGSICDASYTWDKTNPAYDQFITYTSDELLSKVDSYKNVDLVVITGGEPLLWRNPLEELVSKLPHLVEIETNGTLSAGRLLDMQNVSFNVSPKLTSAGNEGFRTIVPKVLKEFSEAVDSRYKGYGRVLFKFVVTRDHWQQDLQEIEALEKTYSLAPIYIMPEGITSEEVVQGLRTLALPVLEKGWRLTTRLHIHIWGNERGR